MVTNLDQKAVDALLCGKECANHLKTLIENGSLPPESLVNTILNSFSIALSFMVFSDPPPPPPPHHESSSRNMAADLEPKRSIKKKREGPEHYRDDCQSPPANDGFSWRKYGQKKIKTATHQRSYYRCAYAKDKNCKATKRVQQIQENPSVYRTTYVGQHICQAHVYSNNLNEDTTSGSTMIQFNNLDQAMPDLVSPQLVSIDQQEPVENEVTNHNINEEFDVNEYLVDDERLWEAYEFPPGDYISLDDLSPIDYNTLQD